MLKSSEDIIFVQLSAAFDTAQAYSNVTSTYSIQHVTCSSSLCPAFLWKTAYASVQPGGEYEKRRLLWTFAFQHSEISGGKLPLSPLPHKFSPKPQPCLARPSSPRLRVSVGTSALVIWDSTESIPDTGA